MSPVVSRQLVEVVDTRAATRTLPLSPDQVLEQALDRWHEARRRRRSPRSGDPAATAIESGAVRIVVDGAQWRCTDLVLGLEVVPGRPLQRRARRRRRRGRGGRCPPPPPTRTRR